MSYCRFGDGDVYLYGDSQGRKVCCDCALPTGMHEAESLHFDSIEDTLEHLEEHVKRGHRVPEYAFERLRRELVQSVLERKKQS